MISLKVDYDILAEEVSKDLGRLVKKHYIKCIMTPNSKMCKDDIKVSIIKILKKNVEDEFDLYHEVEKLFKAIR